MEELLRFSPTQLQQLGLACLSLVCARGLPGAEDVDIPAYLTRVKEWAALVRQRTPRFIGSFKNDPADFNHSYGFFLMSILVQVLKKDLGLQYNSAWISPSEETVKSGYLDSRDLLIHGPLGPTLTGTCNNIPMAVVAVARQLGYPVYLAATPDHVYAKWVEPGGYNFNIEASNPAGMTSPPDEHYRDHPPAMTDYLLQSGCYLRPLSPVDELALCLVSRGWVLEAHGRFAEAGFAYAHALRLAPTEPMYPRIAARCVGRWMRESYNESVSESHRISCKDSYQFQDLFLDPQRLLPPQHIPVALIILARYYQFAGKPEQAAAIYGAAKVHRPGKRDNERPMNGPHERTARDATLAHKEPQPC